MKKIYLFPVVLCLFLFAGCQHDANSEDYLLDFNSTAGTSALPLNDSQKFVLNMGLGWNLGNTFDAYGERITDLSAETCWGQPVTTKAMIDGLVSAGFKTIRIPVSWHNHFVDKNYTLDSAWLERVKEVVDWSIEDGLYVIINIHHDEAYYEPKPISYNDGYSLMEKDIAESEKFLTAVWTQVGNTFADYGEKLIFETMNEPRLRSAKDGESHPCKSGNHEWYLNKDCPTCLEAEKILLEYNQLCIDTIRSTGGNNASIRYISCPNLCGSPDAAFHYVDEEAQKTQIELLQDSAENRLIQSVHMYTPYEFAMEYPGKKEFTTDVNKTLEYYFNSLVYFIKKGYPVIIGETGAVNKNNLSERAEWYAAFTGYTKAISATCCIWDNGNTEMCSDGFAFYRRTEQKFEYPLLLDVAVNQTIKTTEYILNNIESL